MRANPNRDFDFLRENAQLGHQRGLASFIHLEHPIGLWNYIRIADDIARRQPQGHVLDWGCGYGQMTYLLRQRGFTVTAFDIGDPQTAHLPDLPLCNSIHPVYTQHPTQLPFEDHRFDAVLSCGVLEHVDEFSQPGNERLSLREIARVLRPHGQLLIYQLPQRYAWQEAILRRLKLGYTHVRRYTAPEITAMLSAAGYRVVALARANLIPKNLTGLPHTVRAFYSQFSRPLIALDGLLCRLPGFNHLAGVLEIQAQKIA